MDIIVVLEHFSVFSPMTPPQEEEWKSRIQAQCHVGLSWMQFKTLPTFSLYGLLSKSSGAM
jgi:hypothetical protein